LRGPGGVILVQTLKAAGLPDLRCHVFEAKLETPIKVIQSTSLLKGQMDFQRLSRQGYIWQVRGGIIFYQKEDILIVCTICSSVLSNIEKATLGDWDFGLLIINLHP